MNGTCLCLRLIAFEEEEVTQPFRTARQPHGYAFTAASWQDINDRAA
jgi:hypothetical protein